MKEMFAKYDALCCADDLLRDVSWLWHAGSERANVGPGATLPVEHFSLQRPDAHGSPRHLDIQAHKSHLDSLIVIILYLSGMINVNNASCAVWSWKGKWYFNSVWHDFYEHNSHVIDSQESGNNIGNNISSVLQYCIICIIKALKVLFECNMTKNNFTTLHL